MRTFSALWIAYQAETNPTWAYQYQATIDGQTYAEVEIWDFAKTGGLTPGNFSIGNCSIQQLKISVASKAGVTVAKNAKAELFVRIAGEDGTTPWYSAGVFFISGRRLLAGAKLEFDCLDRMAYADVSFLTDGEDADEYPMPMDEAMARIYTQLGTTLDARCTISHTLEIDYPNDMTMREVMGFIASAHGGNFCITEADKLRLVIPNYTGSPVTAIDGSRATKTYPINTPITWDSVAMIYTDAGGYYESGATHLAELELENPWATQGICDAVQAIIAGYTYTPYAADKTDLDPAIELGDYITIDGVACNIWAWAWNTRLYCDLKVPSSTETTTSEFGYKGTITKAMKKKLTLGASYYGTKISKTEGLRITRSDGKGEALFNSDTLAMRALVAGTMVDKLYFDPVSNTYRFEGELSATAITSGRLSSLFLDMSVGGKNLILNALLDNAAPAGFLGPGTQRWPGEETDDQGEFYGFCTAAPEGSGSTFFVDGWYWSTFSAVSMSYSPMEIESYPIAVTEDVYTLSFESSAGGTYGGKFNGANYGVKLVLYNSLTSSYSEVDIFEGPAFEDDPAYNTKSVLGEIVRDFLLPAYAWNGSAWVYTPLDASGFRPTRYSVTFTMPENTSFAYVLLKDQRTATSSMALCSKLQLENGYTATPFKGINVDGGVLTGLMYPEIDSQAATKEYVDDQQALDVKLTGNQTIAGVKAFSSSPTMPTPTTSTQGAPKGYVDGLFSQANWTPTDASGAGLTFTQVLQAKYTKVGRIVHMCFDISWPTTTNGSYAMVTLPFPAEDIVCGVIGFSSYGAPITYTAGNFYDVSGDARTNAQMSGKRVRVSATYRATS